MCCTVASREGGITWARARAVRAIKTNSSWWWQQFRWQFRWWHSSDGAISNSCIYSGNCSITTHICFVSMIYELKLSVRNQYICGAGNRKAVQMLMQPRLWCWRWFWAPQMSSEEADTNRCVQMFVTFFSSIWFRAMWVHIIHRHPLS